MVNCVIATVEMEMLIHGVRFKAEDLAHDAKLRAENLGHDVKLKAEEAKVKGTRSHLTSHLLLSAPSLDHCESIVV